MAALPALPAPPTGIGADTEATKEYTDALTKVMTSLENRNKPNWFNIAAAFQDTSSGGGSFMSGLGKAAGVVGKQQEQAEQEAPNIALMRAQLAGQKYEVTSQAEALGMLGAALGAQPAQLAQDLQSGELPPEQMAKLKQMDPRLFAAISAKNPKIGAIAKDVAGMMNEQARTDIQAGTLAETKQQNVFGNKVKELEMSNAQMKLQLDIIKAGNDSAARRRAEAEFIDKVGFAAAKALGIELSPPPAMPAVPNVNLSNTPPSATSGATAPSPGTVGNPPSNVPVSSQPQPNAAQQRITTAPSRFNPDGTIASTPTVSPAKANAPVADSSMSPANRRALELKQGEANIDVSKTEREARTKPYIAQHDLLAGYDYNTVSQNNAKVSELMTLAQAHPNVFGMLVHQGPIYAALQAAESGISTPIGSLSVPVTEALSKLKLSAADQAVARNAAQLISDLNQSVMKAGKNIFGPSISTFDAQKMAEPGFKATDPASFINYLAAKHKVTNVYMGKMADAQANYFEKNPNASTASFFKSPAYRQIVDSYNATYRDLQSHSPYK